MKQVLTDWVTAYKATNSEGCCRDQHFQIGKTYTIPNNNPIELYRNGFHVCLTLIDVHKHYPLYKNLDNDVNDERNRLFKVSIRGEVDYDTEKIAAREIRFDEEIDIDNELLIPLSKSGDFFIHTKNRKPCKWRFIVDSQEQINTGEITDNGFVLFTLTEVKTMETVVRAHGKKDRLSWFLYSQSLMEPSYSINDRDELFREIRRKVNEEYSNDTATPSTRVPTISQPYPVYSPYPTYSPYPHSHFQYAPHPYSMGPYRYGW
jgi:hypothetical protein